MKKRDRENKIPFTARKSSWLIVLCIGIALIIFLPRTIIMAKYAMNMYDYTGVTAGDFHFDSDYMNNINTGTMRITTISGWTGDPQTARVEIRNFDNALRYNDKDTDVWYYFDVNLYCGADVTTVTDETTLAINDKAEYTVTVQKKKKTGSGATATTEVSDLDLYTYVDEDGNIHPCLCLDGIESSFERSLGTHYLTVTVTTFGETAGAGSVDGKINKDMDQRLSVAAHTITADKLSGIKNVKYSEAEAKVKSNNWDPKTQPNRYDVKEGTTAVGVFQTDLKGVICYTHSADIQEVRARYEKTTDDSRLHHYSLFCTSVAGTSSRIVRVYYDKDTFEFPDYGSTKVTAEGTEVLNRNYYFFDVDIQANSMLALGVLTPWEGAGPEGGGDSSLTSLIGTTPQDRSDSIANNYVLWFEVLGQKAEKVTVTEEYHTLIWYSNHVEENSFDTLNGISDPSMAGFMYVDAVSNKEIKDAKMNRVRLFLAEEIPAGESRTITVGKVKINEAALLSLEKDQYEITDSVTITVSSDMGEMGSYIVLSSNKTFTLEEGERFFIGAPGDTLKFMYRFKKIPETTTTAETTTTSETTTTAEGETTTTEETTTEPPTTEDTPVTAPYVNKVITGTVDSETYTDRNLTVDFGYYQ